MQDVVDVDMAWTEEELIGTDARGVRERTKTERQPKNLEHWFLTSRRNRLVNEWWLGLGVMMVRLGELLVCNVLRFKCASEGAAERDGPQRGSGATR